jgi:hypothetical protein
MRTFGYRSAFVLGLAAVTVAQARGQSYTFTGSRHRRGAGFTLSGHTKNVMRHEP